MDVGRRAMRVSVNGFEPQPDCTSFRLSVPSETSCWREEMAEARFVVIKARSGQPATTRLEMVLLESDGSPWGTIVPLREKWEAIRIPLRELKYFAHWRPNAEGRGGPGDCLHPERVTSVNICFGAWLYGADHAKPHAIDIQDVALTKGE